MLTLEDLHSDEDEALLFGTDRLVWFGDVDIGEPQLDDHSQAEHASMSRDLLPCGDAWDSGGALSSLLSGMSGEMGRFEARCRDLVAESIAPASSELLTDWERVVGLPDPCGAAEQTLEARRAAVWTRWTGRAAPSRAFFLELGRSLGYEIWIDEFQSADEADAADVPFTDDGWAFTWRVNIPAHPTVVHLAVGMGVGAPLAEWGDAALECPFRRYQPAHTTLLFAYRL